MSKKYKFRDYLGIYFLGNKYDPKMWDLAEFKSNSFIMMSLSEEVKDKIFSISRRNALNSIKDKFFDSLLDISSSRFSAYIDIAIFDSEEDKKNKIISKAIIISHSTGLKFPASLKLQYIKKVAQISKWKIRKLEIAYIDKGKCLKFRQSNFIFSKEFSLANEKKVVYETKNIQIKSYLNDEPLQVNFPLNNRGNSKDYMARSIKQFLNSEKNFFTYFDKWEKREDFIEPSISNYQVRTNDGKKWITNSDLDNFIKNKKEILMTSENFEIIKNNKNVNISDFEFDKKRVYFDFETLNLPFAAFDNMQPYQHIPVQYSIVKTDKNNNIYFEKHKISPFDKKNAFWDFAKDMIDSIYEDEAIYIAHNKRFEDTCIGNLMTSFSKTMPNGFEEFENKANEILLSKNSIDTNIIFSKLIKFEDFPEKSSIKILNKWFWKYRKDLFEKYNLKKYESNEDLSINNGLNAQKKLTEMYFGMYSKEELKKLKNNLKKYCENDVKGMLPLLDFIEENF